MKLRRSLPHSTQPLQAARFTASAATFARASSPTVYCRTALGRNEIATRQNQPGELELDVLNHHVRVNHVVPPDDECFFVCWKTTLMHVETTLNRLLLRPATDDSGIDRATSAFSPRRKRRWDGGQFVTADPVEYCF